VKEPLEIIEQEAEWAPYPVWTVLEKGKISLVPAGN
jgi:hypothetical protein